MNLDDGKILIALARLSIETYFSGKIISLPEADKFKENQGVFVTLTKFGHLRGCIGFPSPTYPLKRAIIEAARSAAFKDPRFHPVTEEEMEDITLEISVLTIPEKIMVEKPEDYLNSIVIGTHGLIIRQGHHSGLLLPQVFSEHNSSPKEALELTCEKAGLDRDAWMEEDTDLFSFSAIIFSEEEPHGEIFKK